MCETVKRKIKGYAAEAFNARSERTGFVIESGDRKYYGVREETG